MPKTYRDFLEALGQRESGGCAEPYRCVNRFGFSGKYQMGELALIDIGYYTRDSTPGRNDWQQDHWTGKRGIFSLEDFLSAPEVQEYAIRELQEVTWARIEAFGLEAYLGETINGVVITESGMLGGAHLVGIGSLKSYLESEGSLVPRDGNGVPISEYVRLFERIRYAI
jgi:hypothetical protein